MARDLIRPAGGPIFFPTAAAAELDLEIPKTAAYKALMIELSVDITIGSGATPAVSVWDIVRNIRILADGKLSLMSIDALSLRELNRIWYGSVPPETTFAAATAVYTANLILPIAPAYLYDSAVGLLPAVPLTGLQVFYSLGTLANLYAVPGSAVINSMSIRTWTWEILDLSPELAISPQIISQITHNVVTGTDQEVRLKTGNRLAGILMFAKSVNAGITVPQAAILNNVVFEVSAESTGPQILRNERQSMNRAFNRIYGSGIFGGQSADLAAGMMYMNWHGDGAKSSPLDLSGSGTEAKLRIDETTQGTTPQVRVTQIELIPRRVQ